MAPARDRSWLLDRRLATQRLTSPPLAKAANVVRLLTCVQCQERYDPFFSLGIRSASDTYTAVQAEYDELAFLRTHILRPTWHFVLPEDIRWILDLTSARVESSMGARHRQLDLDDPRFVSRNLRLLTGLLGSRNYLTRVEIGERVAGRRGAVTAGEQLGHLLLIAELRGLICSGPMKGRHHSYAVLDEVVAPAPIIDRDEAHARLAHRFFAGHGPASVKDFARWCSLTMGDTNVALEGLGDVLDFVEIERTRQWFDPSVPSRRSPKAPPAFLFPVYDEAVLTYPWLGFPSVSGHPYGENPDPFTSPVICRGANVGMWKRSVKADRVAVQVWLAPSVPRVQRTEVRAAAQRLADFLERDLAYEEHG